MTDGVNGLLIPIKDEAALVCGMCRLIEDRELASALGAEAAKIGSYLSLDAITVQWLDYINEIIDNINK
jgi:glycosyltransferase involved in cell wall biosynthesis